jgi:NAD(P)-dependent dehydrogenase (short-subunit alcohol dehydrogenase family)
VSRTRRRRTIALVGATASALAAREAFTRAREASLEGEVALVTGSSRGLGLLLAEELGRAGCRLVICARDEADLELARGRLTASGYDVLAIPCDISDADQVTSLVRRAEEHFGAVDILVTNAGVMTVGPIWQMSSDDFAHAHDVIFWGTVHPTLAVLPGMRARGHGRIANVTSIGGRISAPHLLPYSAAKFATVGFSEGLRAEVARDGISVTTIVPGFMRTGSYLNARFKEPHAAEFAWFALGAGLPFVSMDARRAARWIVQAIRRGEAERTLGLTAEVATRFHGLFPGVTADLLGLANRLLPRAPDDGRGAPAAGMTERGADIDRRSPSRLRDLATTWGRAAAGRLNETGAPPLR